MSDKIVKFDRGREPEKKKRKYNDGGIIYGVALILLLGYLGGYLYNFFNREKVPETAVVYGSIEPVMVFDGVIIRDETVYRSPAAGRAVFYKNDLDKVQAYDIACSIQDEEAVRSFTESITNIENSILTAQEDRAQSSETDNQVRELNLQLKRSADSTALAINGRDTKTLYAAAAKAEQLLSRRNQILFSDSRGGLKNLSQGLSVYQSQLEGFISDVAIGSSGIISYKTDGQEERLTPDRLKVISQEETVIKVDYNEIYSPTAYQVQAGDPVFKIVSSNIWHIAAYIPSEQTMDWLTGQKKAIYVDDGTGVFNKLETEIQIVDRLGDDSYVVFAMDKQVTDFMDRRGVSFKIKEGLTEGLKIPNTAIVEKTLFHIPLECLIETDTLSVLRYNASTNGYDKVNVQPFSERETYITVLFNYNDEYGIKLNDILAVPDRIGETRTVAESENIAGVYVTNTGAAVFRQIVTSGEAFENVSYTVIDPAINTNVKVKDRIVSDISGVEEGQMIY